MGSKELKVSVHKEEGGSALESRQCTLFPKQVQSRGISGLRSSGGAAGECWDESHLGTVAAEGTVSTRWWVDGQLSPYKEGLRKSVSTMTLPRYANKQLLAIPPISAIPLPPSSSSACLLLNHFMPKNTFLERQEAKTEMKPQDTIHSSFYRTYHVLIKFWAEIKDAWEIALLRPMLEDHLTHYEPRNKTGSCYFQHKPVGPSHLPTPATTLHTCDASLPALPQEQFEVSWKKTSFGKLGSCMKASGHINFEGKVYASSYTIQKISSFNSSAILLLRELEDWVEKYVSFKLHDPYLNELYTRHGTVALLNLNASEDTTQDQLPKTDLTEYLEFPTSNVYEERVIPPLFLAFQKLSPMWFMIQDSEYLRTPLCFEEVALGAVGFGADMAKSKNHTMHNQS
ncbi:hypothetical protein GH733_009910 [Mirounga leonina]|nr:hypothetical protein GH733_009910 [Mirounga leonina]